MKLSELRNALRFLTLDSSGAEDPEITGVSNHSGKIQPGNLFCAVKGAKSDGHRFLPDAVRSGASALVFCDAPADSSVLNGIPWIRVRDSYFAWGCLCECFAGYPAKQLQVHAVTGTNGKTSTAFLLRHFLKGRRTALLSTVVCDLCGPEGAAEAGGTTPDSQTLQHDFSSAVFNGATDLVMEASSHGLHQHRMGTTQFASAVFSNLTGDHLDYHKTMEHYFQAKKTLFSSMMRPGAPVLINADDEWGRRLIRELQEEQIPVRIDRLSRTISDADCLIGDLEFSERGTRIFCRIDSRDLILESPLIGEHNVYNLLSALMIAFRLGIPLHDLCGLVQTAPPAPGRMERIELPNGAHAFVDYAHTDDALIRAISTLRNIAPRARILTVFGCGGDRDRTKRPRMGKAVSELSDLIFVTSDNPRSEDPGAIIQEILTGIDPHLAKPLETIPDRAAAIRRAVLLSCPGDLILVAGKGHETYQEIQGVRHHFDDREILRSI